MSAPTIVIVGRPNVGKSLLFNRLLRRRRALVHGAPGMTLDFLRERLPLLPNGGDAWLCDTGGVAGESDEWTPLAEQQMLRAADSADLFLHVVDCKTGVHGGDTDIARQLRRRRVPWWLVVNKVDNPDAAGAAGDFYALGADELLLLSAKHGTGLDALRQRLAAHLFNNEAATKITTEEIAPHTNDEANTTDSETNNDTEIDTTLPDTPPEKQHPTSIAIVGRPNVGKSTFVNRLLGDERIAVSERPGTTRDTVSCELTHPDGNVVLIDTAGMRRRRMTEARDKLSVAAARRALAAADCAVLMVDLADGVTHQDKRIAALIEDAGCALAIVANKADLVPAASRASRLKTALEQLPLPPAPAFALSAAGRRALPVKTLLAGIRRAAADAYVSFPTARLNSALAGIVAARAPRQRGRIRPKLRYAHQGGSRPPCIVIHGNAINRIDDSYRRYLASAFAREFPLAGNRIKIVFRSDENPYHAGA